MNFDLVAQHLDATNTGQVNAKLAKMDDRQTLRAILHMLSALSSQQLRLVYSFLRGLSGR